MFENNKSGKFVTNWVNQGQTGSFGNCEDLASHVKFNSFLNLQIFRKEWALHIHNKQVHWVLWGILELIKKFLEENVEFLRFLNVDELYPK